MARANRRKIEVLESLMVELLAPIGYLLGINPTAAANLVLISAATQKFSELTQAEMALGPVGFTRLREMLELYPAAPLTLRQIDQSEASY
ncbi:MAG: hypothetical protein HC857_01080 [Synechococcales cyanobacterium RU_4_20]|nr:hypothetical protein [Synechococcales cyanobacterium RU_4_20]NJR71338.1 hypothetical protein [Synechococcales cyanobacterium CRU_2_2]